MRPLMYGYLRTDLVADQAAEWEDRIRAFAMGEGFDLGTVFRERDQSRDAFAELILELRRSQAQHVVVPSMLHVWEPGQTRHALVARLWHAAAAGIWVAGPAGNRIEVRAQDRQDRGSLPAVHEIWLMAEPTAVAVARVRVRCVLSHWQLGDLQATAERVVSELLEDVLSGFPGNTRVAVGTDKPLLVRLCRGDRLVIEVWDTRLGTPRGDGAPAIERITAPGARAGRRRPETGGNLAWCELPIPARWN